MKFCQGISLKPLRSFFYDGFGQASARGVVRARCEVPETLFRGQIRLKLKINIKKIKRIFSTFFLNITFFENCFTDSEQTATKSSGPIFLNNIENRKII